MTNQTDEIILKEVMENCDLKGFAKKMLIIEKAISKARQSEREKMIKIIKKAEFLVTMGWDEEANVREVSIFRNELIKQLEKKTK